MKLALATLFFAAPAAAFAPSASFGASSALKMSTEASTEKVRMTEENQCQFVSDKENTLQLQQRVWIFLALGRKH